MKRRDNRGFTLIEMLIVVGIIAILVAVSIPMVNSSLEKARVATDMANERAAKAVATTMYLTGDLNKFFVENPAGEVYYDAANGRLFMKEDGTIEGTVNDVVTPYGKCKDHRDSYIKLTIDKDTGEVLVQWSNGSGRPNSAHGIDPDKKIT